MYKLFSTKGRMNRWQFFASTVLTTLVFYLLYKGWLWAPNHINAWNENAKLFHSIDLPIRAGLLFIGATLIAFQIVKRLHDLGRPGVHFWLLLVPFYNLWLLLLMLFKPGTLGANQYGKVTSKTGYELNETHSTYEGNHEPSASDYYKRIKSTIYTTHGIRGQIGAALVLGIVAGFIVGFGVAIYEPTLGQQFVKLAPILSMR